MTFRNMLIKKLIKMGYSLDHGPCSQNKSFKEISNDNLNHQ